MKQGLVTENLDLGVLVPSTGTWDSWFGRSLINMLQHTTLWRPQKELGIKSLRLRLFSQDSSMLVASRQKLLAKAMAAGCTHMLFLDADMTFPKDLAIRMLLRQKPVLAVNCVRRSFPTDQIAIGLDGNPLDSRGKVGVQKVQHSGLAVMMLERGVIEKLHVPLFMMEWIPDLNDFCGEDVYFCAKIQAEAKEDIWVDHDLSAVVGHVGRVKFTQKQVGFDMPGERVEDLPTAKAI